MALSPIELRHEKPGRRMFFGYRRTDVDSLLDEATTAYEAVWRERADLDDQVHHLEQELSRHRQNEAAMREAMLTAERAAEERRAQAARDAELTVREAETKAREILHGAYAERERVRQETERLRSEEADFRMRLRSLLGATLQTLRDHEERLAAGSSEVCSEPTQAA
ncbi:MAG: DivIVA domain-containing protein [Gaiellales bacterium]